MSMDTELEAINAILKAFDPLDADGRGRVFQYVANRLGIAAKPFAGSGSQSTTKPPPHASGGGMPSDGAKFDSFADLFHAAKPETNAQKALVAGYWLQICQNAQDFTAQAANSALKDLGYGIQNITSALDELRETQPVQIAQIQKSGTTKQARKKYKLTHAGVTVAEGMINAGNG